MDKPELIKGSERTHRPEHVRRAIVLEFLSGTESIRSVQRRYGIRGNGSIANWMREFGYTRQSESPEYLAQTIQESMSKKLVKERVDDNVEELLKRVRELEAELRDERIKSHVYNRMITVAEETYKVSIRKKLGTK